MVAATLPTPLLPAPWMLLVNSTVEILEFASVLLTYKNNLPRPIYADILNKNGWSKDDSNLYIKVAKAFFDFKPQDLAQVQPQTILKLAKSKTLGKVISDMKGIAEITQAKVCKLIKDNRKTNTSKQVGIWVMGADGLPVCRIPDIVESDFMTGAIIEKAIKQTGMAAVRIVRQAIESWAKDNNILPLHPEDYSNIEQIIQNNNKDTSVENTDDPDNNKPESTPEQLTAPAAKQSQAPTPEQPTAPPAKQSQSLTNKKLYDESGNSQVADIIDKLNYPQSWDVVVYTTANCSKDIKRLSWQQLDPDKQSYLLQLRDEHLKSFNVGDRVNWPSCPSQFNSCVPCTIISIQDYRAMLDICSEPIPLAQLVKFSEYSSICSPTLT